MFVRSYLEFYYSIVRLAYTGMKLIAVIKMPELYLPIPVPVPKFVKNIQPKGEIPHVQDQIGIWKMHM